MSDNNSPEKSGPSGFSTRNRNAQSAGNEKYTAWQSSPDTPSVTGPCLPPFWPRYCPVQIITGQPEGRLQRKELLTFVTTCCGGPISRLYHQGHLPKGDHVAASLGWGRLERILKDCLSLLSLCTGKHQ